MISLYKHQYTRVRSILLIKHRAVPNSYVLQPIIKYFTISHRSSPWRPVNDQVLSIKLCPCQTKVPSTLLQSSTFLQCLPNALKGGRFGNETFQKRKVQYIIPGKLRKISFYFFLLNCFVVFFSVFFFKLNRILILQCLSKCAICL